MSAGGQEKSPLFIAEKVSRTTDEEKPRPAEVIDVSADLHNARLNHIRNVSLPDRLNFRFEKPFQGPSLGTSLSTLAEVMRAEEGIKSQLQKPTLEEQEEALAAFHRTFSVKLDMQKDNEGAASTTSSTDADRR
jgi:hypothetical protein